MRHPSVTIYHRHKECKVIFPDYETQKAYVDAEYKYCRKVFSDYAKTISKTDRKNAKSTLESKRVAFARHFGYVPKKNSPQLWMKAKKDEPTVA